MSTRPLEESRPRQFRKTKLVDSSLQFKIVGGFLAAACVAAMFQVLLTNRAMMDVVRKSPIVGDELLAHIPGLLVHNLAITLGVLIPVTMVVGILVTHRIAGPIFNMERYLRRIAEGKPPEARCRLREGDNLQDLCQSINLAIAHLTGEHLSSPRRDAEVSAELDDVSSLVSQPDTTDGESSDEESVAATSEPEAEAETD